MGWQDLDKRASGYEVTVEDVCETLAAHRQSDD